MESCWLLRARCLTALRSSFRSLKTWSLLSFLLCKRRDVALSLGHALKDFFKIALPWLADLRARLEAWAIGVELGFLLRLAQEVLLLVWLFRSAFRWRGVPLRRLALGTWLDEDLALGFPYLGLFLAIALLLGLLIVAPHWQEVQHLVPRGGERACLFLVHA